jgi:hypothetical protein
VLLFVWGGRSGPPAWTHRLLNLMAKRSSTLSVPVESRILILRHQRIILDSDLAELYGVPVRQLNQQVKRNRERSSLRPKRTKL